MHVRIIWKIVKSTDALAHYKLKQYLCRWDFSIWYFKYYPGDSNMQPTLRTSDQRKDV